jgi:hypothetical protein
MAPSERLEKQTAGTELVVRAGRRGVTVSSRSPEGLPYCYATDGFYAQLDPTQAGHVLVCRDGHVGVIVGATDTGLRLDFRFGDDVSETSAVLDLGSVLRQVLALSRESRIDEKSGGLVFAMEKNLVAIKRADAVVQDAFPLSDVVILTPQGKVVFSISHILVGDVQGPPDAQAPGKDRLVQAGLAVQELPARQISKQSPIPPAGFWDEPRNVQGARSLAEALGSQ